MGTTTTSIGRLLAQLAEPITEAARAELGATRAHRVRRVGLRAAARVRRAARRARAGLRIDTAAALVVLAAVAGRVARQLRRTARTIAPAAPSFRPLPALLAPVADLATLRAALAPTGPADSTPPADVPDLTGGAYFRAVNWEPDGFTDPAAPAPTGPEPWGVVLPTPRRIDTRRAPAAPADATPVVPEVPAPVAEVPTAEPTTVVPEPAAVEPAPEPVKPTRKPRARKAPAAKLQTIAARVTTPPAVNLSGVRPTPLARFAAGLNSTRFSGAESVRKGWATDSKGAVRVPEADRDALAAKVGDGGRALIGSRAPDVESAMPLRIDPRPFVLTGRGATSTDLPAVVLTREDGETRTVELRLYRTVLHHCPKGAAVYANRDTRRGKSNRYPLAVFAGDPTTYTRAGASGLLMPLTVGIVRPAAEPAAA